MHNYTRDSIAGYDMGQNNRSQIGRQMHNGLDHIPLIQGQRKYLPRLYIQNESIVHGCTIQSLDTMEM